ncbi:methyl-accepting chemotaxis protein [Vibrio sonorensis]|uniref:methyl-accepting chemotaxis protein n=1 Tax=Vibrio sonorensis TaxID=1004316 RepID=UPI0008D9F35F|nr:methyl-accepting chemotaxis protein [Vibrio sonorensis]
MKLWKNMSIVRRVNISFSMLVLLLISVGWLGVYQGEKQAEYLDHFTQKTSPQMLEVSKLVAVLLNVKVELGQLLHTSSPEEIQKNQRAIQVHHQSYVKITQELTRLLENSSAADNEVFSFNTSFNKVGRWHSDLEEILVTQQEVNKKNAQFSLDSRKLERSIYGLAGKSDNMNAGFMANTLSSGLDSITFNTEQALNTRSASQISKLYKNNQNLAKNLVKTSKELVKVTRKYNRTMQRQFESVITQASRENGLLWLHLQAMEERQELELEITESLASIAVSIDGLLALNERSQSDADHFVTAAKRGQTLNIINTIALVSSAIVATLLIAFSISRQIRIPLKRLVVLLSDLANGRLTDTLSFKRNDEFGQLGKDFDSAIDKLRLLLTKVDDVTDQLYTLSQDNRASAEKSKIELNKQNEQTTTVAGAMQQMELSIGEVAQATKLSSEYLLDVERSARNGMNLMQDSQVQTNELAERLDECREVIAKLNSDCKDIGQIVEVIENIAEQTNLLALNAAIESARAGQQGRGFAVVADEVRELASRTASSTSKIQQMIKTLGISAKDAVNIAEQCRKGMQTVLVISDDTKNSMNAIQQSIVEITEQSAQVAVASEQQEKVSMAIAESIVDISNVASANLEGATLVAENAETLQKIAQQQKVILAQYEW